MKAIVQVGYGVPTEVLELREIDKPAPREREVLVRVRAVSLHAGDYFVASGRPFPARFASGWPRPRADYVIGLDIAGIVETVGADVTRFKPGDEVFAECEPRPKGTGACAEYACAAEDRVVPKPADLSFEEAAAIPVSALAALHGLRDAGKVQAGQKVLVNGAAGGVGHYAVQIAKILGAEVTGVCSTRNVAMVREIGADHVIDYTREDFTQSGPYDLILDNVGNRRLRDCWRAVAPGGKHLPNSGRAGMGYLVKGALAPMFVRKAGRPYLSVPNREDLTLLGEWAEEGRLKPILDRTYALDETAEALAYVGSGHSRGKIAIVVPDGTGRMPGTERAR